MTDNEIIKACRKRGLENGSALGLHSGFMDIVADRLEELILEINRQKAEIERLKKEREAILSDIQKALDGMEEVRILYAKDIARAKAEAVKEFAERLTDKAELVRVNAFDSKWAISGEDIDNLVKEFTEGDKK